MSEKVDITQDNVAARIILNAVSTFVSDEYFREKFSSKGPVAEVRMTVNGVEVPILTTLAEIWNRENELLEQRARQRAIEMVTAAGLDPLRQALEEAEHSIREKLGIWEER